MHQLQDMDVTLCSGLGVLVTNECRLSFFAG